MYELSRLIPSEAPIPTTQFQTLTNNSKGRILLYIAIFGGSVFVVIYFYQALMRKSLRNALRQEVMLEVRSQLQEYYRLDEQQDTALHASESSKSKLLHKPFYK